MASENPRKGICIQCEGTQQTQVYGAPGNGLCAAHRILKATQAQLAAAQEARAAAEKERDALLRETPWKSAADALADEVAVLVRRRVIDSRSPAADALLDYRNQIDWDDARKELKKRRAALSAAPSALCMGCKQQVPAVSVMGLCDDCKRRGTPPPTWCPLRAGPLVVRLEVRDGA